MKKHRQLTIVCAGLLIVSMILTYFVPLTVHNLAGRKVLKTMGTYYCTEYCRFSGFDIVSYRKYDYTKVNLENDTYFRRATSEDRMLVREYVDRFSSIVSRLHDFVKTPGASYLAEHYDFDPRCISDGGYVYFQEHIPHVLGEVSSSFILYYFDTESHTMYYFEYVDALEGFTWGSVTFLAAIFTTIAVTDLLILPFIPLILLCKAILPAE